MAQQTITEKCYAYINGSWVQLLDVAPISVLRGMSDNKPETRLADIGSISLSLNNESGIYTPGITAGWKRGIPFKKVITFDGMDYVKFRGAIEDIELEQHAGEKLVRITALDWLDYASKYPIVNPALLTDTTADVAIDTIVSAMPIQPQEKILDSGKIIYPTWFDTVRDNTKAYGEAAKAVNSETGYYYLQTPAATGERLVFESLDYRNGTRRNSTVPKISNESNTRITEDGNTRITENGNIRITNDTSNATYNYNAQIVNIDVEYGKHIINRFTSNAYPKRTDTTPVQIYTSERPFYLPSGKGDVFRVFWRDPVGKRAINAIPPTETSNVKALCHFDRQNGDYYIDETGKSWFAVDAPLVTNIVKYGNGSAYLDGTGSYLYSPASGDWDFGSGNFTVEWYEYRFASTSGMVAFSRDASDALPSWLFGRSNGTNLLIDISSNGSSNDIANGKTLGVITLNTWNHFAISRSGNNFYAFKNGVLTDNWTSASAIFTPAATPIYIGANNGTFLNACIDDVRITKGSTVYTAAFTALSSPLTIKGTFFSMWTGLNSTGTDITGSLIDSAVYGTEGATFTVQNNSSASGYLNINVYGFGVYSDSALENKQEDIASINNFGYQNESLQQSYQQETSVGELEGKRVVEFYAQPRTVLNSISMLANSSGLSMMSFLTLDVGDLIRVTIAKHGIDGMYYIQGISYSINGGIISYTWIVKEAFTLELGLSQLAIEFSGGTAKDAVSYGYIPQVSADTVTWRAFSAWVYLDAVSATRNQIIFAPFSDEGGIIFYVSTHATDVLLNFYSTRFSNFGRWVCPANSFTTGNWAHVFVAFDHSSATNDPIIYVNGVLQILTELATPSGFALSEEGISLLLGNYKTAAIDYLAVWDGKIKDARVYNMNTTVRSVSDLVNGLYVEGAGGNGFYEGMVFQAFVIRTSDLTTYTNLTLSTEKLLEAYNGYIGTPNGSPIARLP